LCENCQRQSCRAFIGLTIHVQAIANIWRILIYPLSKRRLFSIYFARSASAVTTSKKCN